MHLTLLGTGAPDPNPKRRGPSQVVRADGENIVVDCGSGTVHQLVQAGLMPIGVNHVLITHDHSDHNVDLGHFVVTRWIYGDDRPLHVYGSGRLSNMIRLLLELHAYDFEVRTRHKGRPRPLPQVVTHEIEEGRVLEVGSVKVTPFLVEHPPVEPAFGFRFDGPHRSIVLSGDTRPCENLVRHAHQADLLVHECVEARRVPYASGSGWASQEAKIQAIAAYHTLPEQLGLVGRDAQAKLLVVNHMVQGSVPWELRETIARDFAGPIIIGEDLMTI